MTTDWTGQRVALEIEAVAHGGHCVARSDGRVVFVRHTLPGERVLAEVTEDHGGSFCRADAIEVLRAAPGRVSPRCSLSGPGGCGGCDWQHADAATQRELKATVVAEQLRRLAGIELAPEVVALPGGTLGWRSRIRLATDAEGRPGLRANRSHRVIPLGEYGCPLAVPGALDGLAGQRWEPGEEIAVAVDAAGEVHVRAGTSGAGRQLRGGQAAERAAGRQWRLDAHGFWQVHPELPDALAGVVAEDAEAPAGGLAWDLYAGVGLFAAVLAEQVGPTGQVFAVESSRRAVADGRRNLADLPQVRWRQGRVDRVMAAGQEGLSVARPPRVVVLDPPRNGAGRAVVRAIAASGPDRVVYVACDPAVLARDIATFGCHGYRLRRLRAFDAFPMTHHVECVALLEPQARNGHDTRAGPAGRAGNGLSSGQRAGKNP
ncbi:TRAM domain-containing protein [Haloechinothrix sp. LS1_15]|uniref:class I SAM-dependent RNA methyltransferase n=1 Tax=Haloechinothrix sp. LS1_15 TaxID=2652248 RepID=UPI0029486B15|nr:TRAM domain-containing protein [Haloechinothrix sp. LS1_15]MDV6014453.1 class I SAM-dependent RNA methyltransferase [Haloechinothrix sp. LS1_15]